MIKVTIEATTEKEKELLELFRDHLCYSITEESQIKLDCKDWDGHSGGDDAYFRLKGKVKVILQK
jgi:hypothetical protein